MTTLTRRTAPPLAERRECPVLCYLAGMSAGSRPAMIHSLAAALGALLHTEPPAGIDAKLEWVRSFAWHELAAGHVAHIRAELSDAYSARSVNHALASVRGVLKSCWRCGLIDADQRDRASDVPSVRVSRLPAGRHINPAELRSLFAACNADPTPAGDRDAAILALLYGARRAEVASITLADVDLESGRIRIIGKGDKQRNAYVANGQLAAVRAWVAVRGDHDGPLFHPILRGGRMIPDRGMSPQSIAGVVDRRQREAGIAPMTCHDLRRSAIGDAFDAGVDVSALKSLAGHSSADTTVAYDRRGERAVQAAAAELSVPYMPRR